MLLLASPAWAQAPAAEAPAAVPAAPVAAPETAPVAPKPAEAEQPFVVQNPYPQAPVAHGRLPPPRLYAIEPRPQPPRKHGREGAPFSFGIGASFLYRDDVGYARLGAEGHQNQLDLFASYDVLQLGRKVVLAGGLGYRFGQVGDDLNVTSHAMSAELIARAKLGWLAPHLRVAAGVLTSRLRLDDVGADLHMEDHETSGLGVFGAGMTLRTPSRLFETHAGKLASLSLGVLIEGGYMVAKEASFRGRPAGDGEVPQAAPALGSLEQSGGYLRVLGVVRF